MSTQYTVLSGRHRPRQFELHPSQNCLVFGTVDGSVGSIDIDSGKISKTALFGVNKKDTILGLCWLRHGLNRVIVGSGMGSISCGVVPVKDDVETQVTKRYESFDSLTSVHVNCDNQFLAISGYSRHARVMDVETGQALINYMNIHENHINICRFANLSPFLFSTSSFEGKAKTWDIRIAQTKPIYTVKCESGIVMISYSPDDKYLLASALDNEITQFLSIDGRTHTKYDIPKSGQDGNYTRAYYSASGSYIITGACEEQTVHTLCTGTGLQVAETAVYPGRKDNSLYIQSLRGSPLGDDKFCVLVNYRNISNRELIWCESVKSSEEDKELLMTLVSTEIAGTVADVDNEISAVSSELGCADCLKLSTPVISVHGSNLLPAAMTAICLPSPSLSRDLMRTRQQLKMMSSVTLNKDGLWRVDDEDAVRQCGADAVLMVSSANISTCSSTNHGGNCISCFPIHQCIVSCRSELLGAMINEYVEASAVASSGMLLAVDLGRVLPCNLTSTIPVILDYIYGGNSSFTLDAMIKYCIDVNLGDVSFNKCLNRYLSEASSFSSSPTSSSSSSFSSSSSTSSSVSIATSQRLADILSHPNSTAVNDLVRDVCFTDVFVTCVSQLLEASARLQLVELADICECHLISFLYVHTAPKLLHLSKTLNRNKLHQCVVDYIARHGVLVQLADEVNMQQRCEDLGSCKLVEVHTEAKYRELLKTITHDMYNNAERINLSRGTRHKRSLNISNNQCQQPPSALSRIAAAAYALVGSLYTNNGTTGGAEDPAAQSVLPLQHDEDHGNDAEAGQFEEDSDVDEEMFDDADIGDEIVSEEDEEYVDFVSEVTGACLGCFLGHTACAISNAINISGNSIAGIIVIGGRGKHRYQNQNQMLMYEAATRVWKVLEAGGAVCPQSIMYHQTVALEPSLDPTHPCYGDSVNNSTVLLSVGGHVSRKGESSSAPVDAAVHVLDCGILTWSQPVVKGGNSGVNFVNDKVVGEEGVSMLTRHSTVAMHSELGSGNKTHADVLTHITAAVTFAGYSWRDSVLVNNLAFLLCKRDYSTTTKSRVSLSFEWAYPTVRGPFPPARLAHAAAVVYLPEREGGARMIAYGGLGPQEVLQDTVCLKCGTLDTLSRRCDWEVVKMQGPSPGPRQGHSMTAVPNRSSIVMIGGVRGSAMSLRPMADVWILTVNQVVQASDFTDIRALNNRPDHDIVMTWSLLNHGRTTCIAPRSRHICVAMDTNNFLVFGGTDECVIQGKKWNIGAEVGEVNIAGGVLQCSQAQARYLHHAPVLNVLPPCSLHKDMLRLLLTTGHGIFLPSRHRDLTFCLEDEAYCSGGDNNNNNNNNNNSSSSSSRSGSNIHEMSEGVTSKVLVHVHGVIIKARSEVLCSMLCSGMQEALSGVIALPDIRPSVFTALLTFLYTDTLRVDPMDVLDLVIVANQYDMGRLQTLCETFLCQQVCSSSALTLLYWGNWYSLHTLKAACMSFILSHTRELVTGACDADDSLSSDEAMWAELDQYRLETRHAYMTDHNHHAARQTEGGTSDSDGPDESSFQHMQEWIRKHMELVKSNCWT